MMSEFSPRFIAQADEELRSEHTMVRRIPETWVIFLPFLKGQSHLPPGPGSGLSVIHLHRDGLFRDGEDNTEMERAMIQR